MTENTDDNVTAKLEPIKPPYFSPLTVEGKTICLAHLEPFVLLVPPVSLTKHIRVNVTFSNHCFSESFDERVHDESHLEIWDGQRRRVFDQIRYSLSLKLPDIIRGLPGGHVFQTPELNYVKIVIPTTDGETEYRVFFNVKKAPGGSDHDVKMVVESAYAPTGNVLSHLNMTKVRFKLLVEKTMRGQKISRHNKR